MEDSLTLEEVNSYLVMILKEVLTIQEKHLQSSQFSDLTIGEMHIIEAVGLSGQRTSSELAQLLGLTQGTVSVAIKNLVKKGYVNRLQDTYDRRIYRLALSKVGRQFYRIHRKLHMDMVKYTLQDFDQVEVAVMKKGLQNLYEFLEHTKENIAKKDDANE